MNKKQTKHTHLHSIAFRCILTGAILMFSLTACDREYLPKPLGYNRLELPEHAYRNLPDTLPYTFQYSQHARMLRDTSVIHEKFWIEIYYPDIKSNIHITYKPLHHSEKLLKEYMDDAYTLTAKLL